MENLLLEILAHWHAECQGASNCELCIHENDCMVIFSFLDFLREQEG